MYKIFPDYYKEFRCIAGKCQHTCCASWEIDIDEESFARYKKDGIAHISDEGTPHFVMNGTRCPYLNKDNLCELFIRYGEGYLCQICTDHPRFRNYWTDTEEIGLGLSCEAAAWLILGRKEPMDLILVDAETEEPMDFEEFYDSLPEDEQYVFDLRDQLLMQALDTDDPMEARLAEYFIFRQLPDALYDGMLDERLQFISESIAYITEAWSKLENPTFENKCEIARAYSDAIEYDTEKLNMMLNRYQTLRYYNENAEAYASSTKDVDFSKTQDRFLSLLDDGANILDFGCGSGRDTKYFIAQGFQVDAIDGSSEMCEIASELTGIPVKMMLFQEFNDFEKYDAIWACSSILHLSKTELKIVLDKMAASLKANGYIYASFKYGDFEGVRNDRYFIDFTFISFTNFIKEIDTLKIEESWITGDVRPGREEESWLNVILRKK